MRCYMVNITDEALEDMDQLYYHIAVKLCAKENALGQYNRIADSILTLETMPERYPIMGFEPEDYRELRLMPVDNYSVIYLIEDDTVTVTNVLYSGSDIRSGIK